jgi:HSP20 family protein
MSEKKREEKERKNNGKQNQALTTENRESRTGIARRETYSPGAWGSPFSFMRRFSEQMDRLFEDFGFGPTIGTEFGRVNGLQDSLWSPQVEVFERGNQLVVRADLPGLTRDDINVDITDEAIVLQGERNQESVENEKGFYRSERSYGSFYRTIPLPEGIDAEAAKATFRNGVLEIIMPVLAQAKKQSRRVEISDSSTEPKSHASAKAAGR